MNSSDIWEKYHSKALLLHSNWKFSFPLASPHEVLPITFLMHYSYLSQIIFTVAHAITNTNSCIIIELEINIDYLILSKIERI